MDAAASKDPASPLLFELLDATESLASALADQAEPEAWLELLERRDGIVAALEQAYAASADRPALAAPARACLERIESLDRTILAAGREGLARLQRERLALGSRRRAVQALGVQERDVPRALTVKA